VYLDSSAIVKLVHVEAETAALRTWVPYLSASALAGEPVAPVKFSGAEVSRPT
jgi:hypothetical protein